MLKFNIRPGARAAAKKALEEKERRDELLTRLSFAASSTAEALYEVWGTTPGGLDEEQAEASRETYGANVVTRTKKISLPQRVLKAFLDPFTLILLALAAVSFMTDVLFAKTGEKNPATAAIIAAMILLSGLMRLIQEKRGADAAEKLSSLVTTTACIERREEGKSELPLSEVVVGDLIYLSAGDMVPADLRVLGAKDLFVSQAALTGEATAVEKSAAPYRKPSASLLDCPNLCFMGTNVVSGSAVGIVAAVGDNTFLGDMVKDSRAPGVKTGFDKGVNEVSGLLIRLMLAMAPVVLFLNGFTKGDWLQAALFAVSVAVGLTPAMLPMIVTVCLAKGAVTMSRKKTVIKSLGAIQNLGSMDIMCTDKTGTLTKDKVELEYHLNIHGDEDVRVLRHAFLNSFYQTGLKNLMDVAIIARVRGSERSEPTLYGLSTQYRKVDEVPFDFERRRMSVVVADMNGKTQMITKGAVEEMLAVCTYAEYLGEVVPLSGEIKAYILSKVDELNESGMRVIAVAQKTNPSPVGAFAAADEKDMVLIGYLAFLDPPKESAAQAIKALEAYGVKVKVLTGDNEKVTRCICRQVGIPDRGMLTGADVEAMTDEALSDAARRVDVFAKLSPQQKARVISTLRAQGHCVGYMGDGINDASAMKAADVSISVDTAVDIAKETADVILLEKDLLVLEEGVLEGRRIYANMLKYMKITASSNFGNMFSVLAASAFLPFLPMSAAQLLLLNLTYDVACTAMPWDNVDREYLVSPRKWDASSIKSFLFRMGPVSSLFDITTYLMLFFVVCPALCGAQYHALADPAARLKFASLFQTGWFMESMWTQIAVIHTLRSPKLPFVQSRASLPVYLATFGGAAALTALPYTPLGALIGLMPLPGAWFAFLALTVALYMLLATLSKKGLVRKYGTLL
ncbi:MAG: magnesium-translocating P-type ATPase [Eubacteriales bacterium]|nr:magnesium-translocating P-type ATPase [Eubacteriales bacterium]